MSTKSVEKPVYRWITSGMIKPYESRSFDGKRGRSNSALTLADHIRNKKERNRLLHSSSSLLVLRYIELCNSWANLWRSVLKYALCDSFLSGLSRSHPICRIEDNGNKYTGKEINPMMDIYPEDGGVKQDPVTQNDVTRAVAEAMSARDVNEIKTGLENLGKKFDTFLETLAENYVTKTEFNPVKNIVYGACGIILTSFVLGLFYLISKTK